MWATCFILPLIFLPFNTCLNSTNYACGPLYITIKAHPKNYVILNWKFTCDNPPNLVRFVTLDDFGNTSSILNTIDIDPNNNDERSGSHQTKHTFDDGASFPGKWNEDDHHPQLYATCFSFAIESVRNGVVVDRKCFKLEPTWMSQYGKLKIGSLMIPGTHDSGSYKGFLPILNKFLYTQQMDLFKQLAFGIRYFDFRAGVYDGKVYLNHDLARLTPMEPELERIKKFINKSPKEIIIIDVHAFPAPINFNLEHHNCVLDLFKKTLGDHFVERNISDDSNGPTLESLWKVGKKVIVSYNEENLVKEYSWLWKEVTRHWGDVINVKHLKEYIINKTSKNLPGNPMKVLMAELTPTMLYDVLQVLTGSIKQLADEVNPLLDKWLRTDNRFNNVNIIATDFFLGNNMINLALETNNKKIK